MLKRPRQRRVQLDMRALKSIFPEVSNSEEHINHVSVLVCWVLLLVPADSGGCSCRCDVAPGYEHPRRAAEGSNSRPNIHRITQHFLFYVVLLELHQLLMPRLATTASAF